MNEKFTYGIIESTIEKEINNIKNKGNDAIRNLINILTAFSNNWPVEITNITSNMLYNPNSPYYRLINNIVNRVDKNVLKQILINLGYNCFTIGSKIIKSKENQFGFTLPNTIAYDFRIPSSNAISIKELEVILQHSENNGIYSGIFFVDNDIIALQKIINILSNHQSSVYLIFVKPSQIKDEIAKLIHDAKNIIVSIYYDSSYDMTFFKNSVMSLNRYRCLYGAYSMIYEEQITNINNDNFFLQLTDLRCSFVILFEVLNNNMKKSYTEIINNIYNKIQLLIIDFNNLSMSLKKSFVTIYNNGDIAIGLDKKVKDVNIHNQSFENAMKNLKMIK